MYNFTIGMSLGRYQIQDVIAKGGMAVVFRAYDPLLNRVVAVKLLREDLIATTGEYATDFLQMFEQEAKLAASLEHPNILPVYDYGYHQGQPYIVSRYTTKGTLDALLREQPLTVKVALRLVERLASAIDYYHSRGVIHRDLKPPNILLGEQNHPYISDFGLAHLPRVSDFTAGSPFYMAPEQWLNEGTSHRTDLFAFGIIVFQCLTNHYPIPEGLDPGSELEIKEFRTNPINNQLPLIRKYFSVLPLGVELVLSKLTKFQPEERYNSATAATDALRNAFYSGRSKIEGRVFISYSRKDSEYVYNIVQQLLDIGVDIWIDRNLKPGSLWDKEIEQALNECKVMLVVLSPSSVESVAVTDEWSCFLEKGKEVYPFLLEKCDIPYRLRRKQ